MTTLIHFPGREGQRPWLLYLLPSRRGRPWATETNAPSPPSFCKLDGDDHGHTPPLLRKRRAAVITSFTPLFWKRDGGDHGHWSLWPMASLFYKKGSKVAMVPALLFLGNG